MSFTIAGTFTIVAGSATEGLGYSNGDATDDAFGTIDGGLNGDIVDAFYVSVGGIPTLIIDGSSSIFKSLTFTSKQGDVITLLVEDGTPTTFSPPGCTLGWTWPETRPDLFAADTSYTVSFITEPAFNCCCDDDTDNETLSELRRRMLVRLGYSAQAGSPPPGMADLLDDFLVQAQRVLYRRFRALRTTRVFSWTMAPGQRYYDIPANDDTCSKKLDPYEVEWCGFSDLNGIWLELIEGIPPEFYTSVSFRGYPSRYEIRQCIEIFPAPAAAYTLRIKGKFGLSALVEDDDKTTIDSELVFLWALGNAKAHYGQPDANSVIAQANQYLRDLTAGAHLTARYVPGTSPSQPWTQPKFLPISGS